MSVIIPTVAADGAQSTVTLPAPNVATGAPRVPAGFKGRFSNIVPSFDNPASQAPGDIWASQWTSFNDPEWGFNAYYKPELQDAVVIGNGVRFWGNTKAYLSLGSTTYFSYVKTALDYMLSLGLYVYFTGTDFYPAHLGTPTNTDIINYYTTLAELLVNYPNIVGLDISNEVNGALVNNGSATFSCGNIISVYESIYSIVSGTYKIPCSTSLSCNAVPIQCDGPAGGVYMHQLLVYTDFLDYHLYYGPPVVADINNTFTSSCPWQSSALHKNVVFGEFGSTVATYQAVLNCVNNSVGPNGEKVSFAALWDCWDVASGSGGMYVTQGYPDIAPYAPFHLRTDGAYQVWQQFPDSGLHA